MATAGKLQDDFLTCSVCMEVYQQPVTLVCQHSFCETCLKKYLNTRPEAVANKYIPCPTCRQETPVPNPQKPVEEWAGQLKPGLLLTGLLDLSVVDDINCCSMCLEERKTTPASTWCEDCQACFCDDCIKLHDRVPTARSHDVSKLTGDRKQKMKKKFLCKKHKKKMKLFCRDCKTSLCTLCCSICHRKCEDVITIEDMMPEVTGQLVQRQEKLDKKAENIQREIAQYGDEVDKVLTKVKAVITKTVKETIDSLREKKTGLIERLDVQTAQQTEKLRSKIKGKQAETRKYQEQSQFIQQALEVKDEAQLIEMYLSTGPEVVADITETQDEEFERIQRKARVDITGFVIHELEKLKEEIVKSIVKVRNYIDLTATPVLQEVLDAKLGKQDCCDVRDVVVMSIADAKVTVFADCVTQRLISIYQKGNRQYTSMISVPGYPWCITVISEREVAVSLPDSQFIIMVAVAQAFKILSTIQTSKKYKGLSKLDQSNLVAGSDSPPSIDLIDMQGHILRTFTTLPEIGISFSNPRFIHVTKEGNILVSDCGLNGVMCITRAGETVFSFISTWDSGLKYPFGITTTETGDILVADWDTHKIVHLSRSGKYIRDILTAKDGLKFPFGLTVDEDKICVSLPAKGLLKYKFL